MIFRRRKMKLRTEKVSKRLEAFSLKEITLEVVYRETIMSFWAGQEQARHSCWSLSAGLPVPDSGKIYP
ncbi:MAG: hypothetical protein MZV63_32475 [Marinilabiliales bacterium]|nr:hypothetical protein [Marinilabiliales bacterium]